jgi:hypothetical protein
MQNVSDTIPLLFEKVPALHGVHEEDPPTL